MATDLGKVSFDAANGVGTIYSPKVTMKAGEVIFDDFAVGASKGFMGYGPGKREGKRGQTTVSLVLQKNFIFH